MIFTLISHTYLKPSSVALTLKRKTMHTFSDQFQKKLSNRRKKFVSLCLKEGLKLNVPRPVESEQYLELPSAIATSCHKRVIKLMQGATWTWTNDTKFNYSTTGLDF